MTRPSWIGQTLDGRYRIDDILGQGGMSAVYKAYDPNLKRVVAVKMIHAHLAEDPKFVVRFTEEAAAVAQLRHPNIVQVYDFNHEDNLYYMVQEFVEGETLQERLRRLNKNGQRMPLNEAIGYILKICDATGYAHQRGLIHRDIKPANIMLDPHGQAILMDFGIVKIAGGEKHTETGAVVGTALYLPPELIVGETPDPRSDEYSLAITLFETVSGRPPFEADSAMTLMMMHLNDPVPDLRQLRSDVPAGLVAIISKALSKKREHRYASMAEFASALRGVQASLSTMVPATTLADQSASQVDALMSDPDALLLHTAAPQRPSDVKTNIEMPVPAASPGPSFEQNPPAQAEASVSRTPPPAPILQQSQLKASQPLPSPSGTGVAGRKPSRFSPALWIGILGASAAVIVFIGIIILGLFLLRGRAGKENPLAAALTSTTPTATQPAATPTPILLPSATLSPTITSTAPPTATPTITLTPTPTIPVGVPYSRINAITVNDQGFYVVDYETFEYTEKLPGEHVHFFFNSVSQDQAGSPGSGPWKLYGGPRPFDGYSTSDRPEAATQLCILVANADHSVQPNSGNCVFLPDVQIAMPFFDDPCLAGPDPAYPVLTQLKAGQLLRVAGISPDEVWWAVDHPVEPGQTCWLQRNRSAFSGDLSTLPLAEAPPLPEAASAGMSVQITGITLDDQDRYILEFTPLGFTPALPGTHIHFFFDTYLADQSIDVGGKRLMYGGASPFTGFTQADRPPEAKQLCALVANPDHTVIEGSGNCLPLPGVNTSLTVPTIFEEARSWPLAFQDSFVNNQNNWPTGLSNTSELGSVNRRIENGRYQWEVIGQEPSVWWAATDQVSALDFYLAATAQQVSGSEVGEFGLVFRKNTNQDYLVYKISNIGRYALYQFQNSSWTALIDWSDTVSLLKGGVNRMEVIAQGSTLFLVLNGDLIAQYNQAVLAEGQAGFFVGTSNPGDAGFWEFDDFEIRLQN